MNKVEGVQEHLFGEWVTRLRHATQTGEILDLVLFDEEFAAHHLQSAGWEFQHMLDGLAAAIGRPPDSGRHRALLVGAGERRREPQRRELLREPNVAARIHG